MSMRVSSRAENTWISPEPALVTKTRSPEGEKETALGLTPYRNLPDDALRFGIDNDEGALFVCRQVDLFSVWTGGDCEGACDRQIDPVGDLPGLGVDDRQ